MRTRIPSRRLCMGHTTLSAQPGLTQACSNVPLCTHHVCMHKPRCMLERIVEHTSQRAHHVERTHKHILLDLQAPVP
jgi:hypothetical protein